MRKEELIKALEKERDQFKGRGQSTADHDAAIDYLKTGMKPQKIPEGYDVLDAAVNDYDTLENDYLN
jgi:hypothetical protein